MIAGGWLEINQSLNLVSVFCRPVYFSKAGNIARLVSKATSAGELTEILLAARGQAKEASFADAPTRDTVTGLQGTVMK